MVISVSNKGIHRYKYLRKKKVSNRNSAKEEDISFGEVLANIQNLRREGILSPSNINSDIDKAINNYKKCK